MQLTIEPLVYPERWSVSLEQEIISWMDDVIFKPLNDIIEDEKMFVDRQNSDVSKYGVVESALVAALNSGSIWYVGDTFYGQLNSKISKELRNLEAKFDTDSGTFKISMDKMPYSLRSALISSKAKAKELHKKSISLLGIILNHILDTKTMGLVMMPFVYNLFDNVKNAVDKSIPIESEFEDSSLELADSIKKQIAEELMESLEISVKDYAIRIIKDLNKCIINNETKFNGRTDKLKDCVRLYHSVAKKQANQLSAQHASVLVSKYIKERAKALGSSGYIWNTKMDNRVRHSHERLEGKAFDWDDPPIVDLNTGRRGHPGEDYNCRCSAKIILTLSNTLKEEGVLV